MAHGPEHSDHDHEEEHHEGPSAPETPHTPEHPAAHPTPTPSYPAPAPVHPAPTPAHPTPAPVHPAPAPAHPTPTPAHPTPAPTHPAPAPVHPTPAPTHPAPAPAHPAPAPAHPAPAPAHPAPAPAPVHPAPAPAHPTSADHDTSAPIHDAHGDAHGHNGHGHSSGIWASITTTAKNTWDTLTHIDDPNHDPIPAETKEVSGWMTPVAMTKSMIRGSVTNVLKRAGESISPIVDAGEAAFYTVTSPILHPIETADNFEDYLSHPKRIITATARAVKNVLKAPITLANEAYQGIVQRPLEQLNHKIKKIPLIGGIIAGTSNLAAKVLGWPLKFADRKAKEWTAWIDEADEKTKGQQAGHLAKANYAPVPATLATA